jgi:hypothetical protein
MSAPDPADYWSVPAYLPYVQAKLTPTRLAAAEKQLGVRLPKAMVALLQAQNGGYLRWVHPEIHHDAIWGLGSKRPSLTDNHFADWMETGRDGLVAFDGDGHTFMCLDYRRSGPRGEPSVTRVDTVGPRVRRVAASFAGCLARLGERERGPEIVIDGGLELHEVAALVGAALRVEMVALGDFDHGYPQYRAALGKRGAAEWVWVSPNLVPAAFQRATGDKVVVSPERALLRLELSPTAIVISCTEGVEARVRAACQQAFG